MGEMRTTLADSRVEYFSQYFVLTGSWNRVLLEELDIATEGTDKGDGLGLWDLCHAGCLDNGLCYLIYPLEREGRIDIYTYVLVHPQYRVCHCR